MIFALILIVTIYAYLLVGIAAAIFVCVLYVTFTDDEIYKSLGIRTYKSIIGGLSIKKVHAKYGTAYYLPGRLMWLDVIELADGAFRSPKNEKLEEVYLPATLERIGEGVFDECPSLKKIYFEGTEEKWNKIESKSDFSSFEIVYNSSYPALPPKAKKGSAENKKS